jgi:hypothetical protein
MKILAFVCLFIWIGNVLKAQVNANFIEEQKTVFDLADKYVRAYALSLPEFIATQSSCRYIDKKGLGTNWKRTQCVEEEVLSKGNDGDAI